MIRDAFSLAVRMISPIVYRLDKMVEVRRFVRNFRKGGGGGSGSSCEGCGVGPNCTVALIFGMTTIFVAYHE